MARFLKHTSCPECGSSDAKGLYDDGSSFCFSCKHSTRATKFSNVCSDSGRNQQPSARLPPDDLCSHFSSDALGWLGKSGIGVETLIKHNVRYSPSKNQIVFTWPSLDVWQARNVWEGAKQRYFTSGDHSNAITAYYCGTSVDRILLTEDCLSAIKCCNATNVDVMPLLGSHLPTAKMKALKRLYKRVDVFLDEDKYKDALKISKRLQAYGFESKCYLDKRDPKLIPYDELKEILDA